MVEAKLNFKIPEIPVTKRAKSIYQPQVQLLVNIPKRQIWIWSLSPLPLLAKSQSFVALRLISFCFVFRYISLCLSSVYGGMLHKPAMIMMPLENRISSSFFIIDFQIKKYIHFIPQERKKQN